MYTIAVMHDVYLQCWDPGGSCRYMVYTWALKRSPYRYFGAYVSTITVLGPFWGSRIWGHETSMNKPGEPVHRPDEGTSFHRGQLLLHDSQTRKAMCGGCRPVKLAESFREWIKDVSSKCRGGRIYTHTQGCIHACSPQESLYTYTYTCVYIYRYTCVCTMRIYIYSEVCIWYVYRHFYTYNYLYI